MADEKIMIVDEEEDLVELLVWDMKKRGYQAVTAANGEEGLAKARAEKPSLIIFDIKMPKMDGYTFVKNIKKDPALSSIRLIALSAYDMKDMFEIEGVDDYFLKSIRMDALFDSIDHYFSRPPTA